MSNKIDEISILNRTPKEAKMRFIDITLVRMGAATSIAQFMVAMTIGHAMTFWNAMLATCLGSLILEFISLGLGYAGMKEGLSTSMLSRWCGFGRLGSVLVGVVISVCLLGWFGIQNAILADCILNTFNYPLNFKVVALIIGLAFSLLVAFGIKTLATTAKIAVPLFFIVIAYIFLSLVIKDDVVLQTQLGSTKLSLSEGTTAIAGAFMIGAIVTPDYSRFCKTKSHLFWMVTLCIIVGEFLINAVSVLIAQSLNSANIVEIVTINAGIIGLASVILSAIKINDLNLYSSSLGIANALEVFTGKKWNYFKLTLCIGLFGTVLSMLGILNRFVDFLSLLGVVFPPIAGVMLVDYYLLKSCRKLLDETREQGLLPDDSLTPLIGWSAIAACIIGAAIGLLFKVGIPSLNSIVAASAIYWLLAKIKLRFTPAK